MRVTTRNFWREYGGNCAIFPHQNNSFCHHRVFNKIRTLRHNELIKIYLHCFCCISSGKRKIELTELIFIFNSCEKVHARRIATTNYLSSVVRTCQLYEMYEMNKNNYISGMLSVFVCIENFRSPGL